MILNLQICYLSLSDFEFYINNVISTYKEQIPPQPYMEFREFTYWNNVERALFEPQSGEFAKLWLKLVK